MAEVKDWTVVVTVTQDYEFEVRARTPEEAEDIAEDMIMSNDGLGKNKEVISAIALDDYVMENEEQYEIEFQESFELDED